MRSGGILAINLAAALFWAAICAAAPPDGPANDSAPWHVLKASRLSNVHDAAAAAADLTPQKYLHVEVRFRSPAESQKKHNFRVVNQRGDEVGELWGWNDARSLVIFEGSWGSLAGLYLDGNGHRKPLVAAAAPRPVAKADVQEEAPSLPAQRVPIAANVPERRVVVENRDQVVVRPPEQGIIHEPDHVVVGQPDHVATRTIDRIVVREPDHVVAGQPESVVVRQGGRVVLEGRVGADGTVVVQPGAGRVDVAPDGSSASMSPFAAPMAASLETGPSSPAARGIPRPLT